MIGGFGNVGVPHAMIEKLADKADEIKGLTIIAADLGTPNKGLGKLVRNKQIKKTIGSYFSYNPEAVKEYFEGRLELELIPQGNLAECVRAGGAGIGGFYCPVGVGTDLFKDVETKIIAGEKYVFVEALKADYALLHAYKADKMGNLVYNNTARNFNPMMARAAKFTIVEAEEIVEVGELDPMEIITPFLYVNAIVKVERRNPNDR
jgi:3-oxoacid CoA-transferase A subunit